MFPLGRKNAPLLLITLMFADPSTAYVLQSPLGSLNSKTHNNWNDRMNNELCLRYSTRNWSYILL